MVGEEEVKELSAGSDLQEGVGETGPLTPNGNFEWRPHRTSSRGYVYFISCGEHIKIGFSTRPLDRLRALQTSHPDALEILGTIKCNRSLEAKLHKRFADLRVRGEWFDADQAIMAYIDRHSIERKAELPKLSPATREAVGQLMRLRNRYDYDTPQGHVCSNMIELLCNHEFETDEMARGRQIESLAWQKSALAQLLSAGDQ